MDFESLKNVIDEEYSEYSDRIWSMYNAPFARFMGIEPVRIGQEETICRMTLKDEYYNSMGRGHGAAVYALIDHTFAFATNITRDCTGIETNVSYHRPAMGTLTAKATPVNRSRSLEHYSVEVRDENDKLVASATCVSFVLNK